MIEMIVSPKAYNHAVIQEAAAAGRTVSYRSHAGIVIPMVKPSAVRLDTIAGLAWVSP